MRTTSRIETRKEAALIAYAADGPEAAVRTPPTSGPTAQLEILDPLDQRVGAG